MKRHQILVIVCLVIAAAFLTGGADSALAGPGGGTYYANSPAGGVTGTAIRKFVDSLPGLTSANKNNLGQYIPLAIPDTTTYSGSDYYEIELKEYTQRMHSDLPKATKLRGYRQINTTDPTVRNVNQYLGPLILATKDRAVRIKFINSLPTGTAGNLFIPVDTSMMGAGLGPNGAAGGNYKENRATLHLHGGNSPWISDGTPHQWTVPAGETTPYKKGVSTRDVPDMPATPDGQMTFYWTNQQSARMMFYHDHAYGITRLNVYAGEAAGYVIRDPAEEDALRAAGVPGTLGTNPANWDLAHLVPLVIQEKTFVPQNIAVQDSKWDMTKWGQPGDLWFPHVYEANQDPYSPSGANPFGRWDYGPWFWPPVNVDAAHSVLPEPTTTPEAFGDTPIVNGTAYPYVVVQPRPYRFRILNASNDRSWNLQLYYADPADPTGKDVKMVPAAFNPTYPATWPTDGRDGGVPDPATVGPEMIQIGTESGLLPNPVVIPNRPIGFDYNRRNIVVLNTLYRALFLGPAERADVIIDFSQVPPGSKLILYNDAPTPNPAFDPRYDYYTAAPDQSPSGGAPSTIVGYGPNTRTIMQIQVAGSPGTPLNLTTLQTALPAIFKTSQPAPIVPETVYNSVGYGTPLTNDLYSKISDYSFSFTPYNDTISSKIEFRPKAIQELWDPWGRMNATLGVELPFTNSITQTTIPMGYAEPATEVVTDGQPQIWKITHNGVDTHPVHFHLFDVQVINRVGWDGAIRPPDENEYGWKETVRMSPLEDIIVALKPHAQTLPFALTTSSRLLDPTTPVGTPIPTTDLTVSPPVATTVPNSVLDYGYEYVWHCHILGHEENDFMRPLIFRVPTTVPTAASGLTTILGGQTANGITNDIYNEVVLTWTDNASNLASFRVERAPAPGGVVGTYAPLGTVQFLATSTPSFIDTTVNSNTRYAYRVFAYNKLGDSGQSNVVQVTTPTWSKATTLTVTPSKPSPHFQGTNVIFTAIATGPSSSLIYHYRYSLGTGGVSTVVQDYSPLASWALPDTAPTGTYTVTVDALSGGPRVPPPTPDMTTSLTYVVVVPAIPIASASPIAGTYSGPTVTVTLSANVPANIYYTTNGTAPTALSTRYAAPFGISTSTTINFIAVDANGSSSVVNTVTYLVHALDLTATMLINSGAISTNTTTVNLTLIASDPTGVAKMTFSNDDIHYTTEEIYATSKTWDLNWGLISPPVTDGTRTVYVRFRDNSLPTPGTLYPPVIATIAMDTTAPVVSVLPIPGIYASAASPLSVTLTPNEPATIYYTTDMSTPTTTASVYMAPILVGTNKTIKFFAIDLAGNPGLVSSGTYSFDTGSDITGIVSINNGVVSTNTPTVMLTLFASDPVDAIASMQISNDQLTWSSMTYTTSQPWILNGGDGLKTVYVKFTDSIGGQSGAFTASIVLATGAPITTASPIPGIYSTPPVNVSLTSSNPFATIYYTSDLSAPTTSSPMYTGPISLNATTTLKYFAVDISGNVELYSTSTWTISPGDLVSSIGINNGATLTKTTAVSLQLSATDPAGVSSMQFSNDGAVWSNEEAYATTKSWTLTTGDGLKTVYARFRDNALPAPGFQYTPVTAQITLDTTAPISSASPAAGMYSFAPLVTLTSNEPGKIYYTTDGSAPTNLSTVYTTPIQVSAPTGTVAVTTVISFFAEDLAGNAETFKSQSWVVGVNDMTASVQINAGAALTSSPSVTLTLFAQDPAGVDTVQFSYDNINYTAEEPFPALPGLPATGTRAWTLISGDGPKTVYVRYRDASNGGHGAGFQYPPVSASIKLDTTPPVTSASPVPGDYTVGPVMVTLSSSETSTIYYTTNGSTPDTGSTVYTGPIAVPVLNTIKYFSVDAAGNMEAAVKSGTWSVHVTDLSASIVINNNEARTNKSSVNLHLNASDPMGVQSMQFSNDGVTYTAEEPYALTKPWVLSPGDGIKTVYVRFRDNTLPSGYLYNPQTATVVLDTVAPVTTAGPVPGDYVSTPVTVTLVSNEPSTIYYTIDGTDPNTGSAVYTGAISILANTTIKYFGVDTAGNTETTKIGTWTIHSADMTGSISINNHSLFANNPVVSLAIVFSDPSCTALGAPAPTMQISNDGSNYTAEEAIVSGATRTKPWTLVTGDGLKYVYVKFRDCALGGGFTYAPITASITLDTTPPVTAADHASGTYYTTGPLPFKVTLHTSETASVYYTTDGFTTPTTSSPLYTGPIEIATGVTTTIQYFSVDLAGNAESTVKTGFWIVYPDGDLGYGGTMLDALKAMQIATGIIPATASDLMHGDVAPLKNNKPNPDRKIDLADVMILLRKAIGAISW